MSGSPRFSHFFHMRAGSQVLITGLVQFDARLAQPFLKAEAACTFSASQGLVGSSPHLAQCTFFWIGDSCCSYPLPFFWFRISLNARKPARFFTYISFFFQTTHHLSQG